MSLGVAVALTNDVRHHRSPSRPLRSGEKRSSPAVATNNGISYGHGPRFKPKKKRNFRGARRGSSSGVSSSSSTTSAHHYLADPSLLYISTSQNCPCDHHRRVRTYESIIEDVCNDDYGDDETSVPGKYSPDPGYKFASNYDYSAGDSGVNSSNSNGSRRSSGRSFPDDVIFNIGEASKNSRENITTTAVILESCDKTAAERRQRENKTRHQSFNSANNWTLRPGWLKSSENGFSNDNSLVSNLSSARSANSNSLSNICTCQDTSEPVRLLRTASYPRMSRDPHRFNLPRPRNVFLFRQPPPKFQKRGMSLSQLPSVPARSDAAFFWQAGSHDATDLSRHSALRRIRSYSHQEYFQQEVPPCVRQIIMQQLQSPAPQPDPKEMKKIARQIVLPEDPHDPAAFTMSHDNYLVCHNRPNKSPLCRSKQVAKIVGTFSFLMTMGIIITVLCFIYWSGTFKPMTMM